MTDIIQSLQDAIETILETTATDLTGLIVVTSDDLRALDQIAHGLSGSGLVCVLITPDLEFSKPKNINARMQLRIIEKVLQNRSASGTGYAGSYWAIHIASWLWDRSVGEEWDTLTVRSITQVDGTEETLEWVIELETFGLFDVEADPPEAPEEPEP